MRGARQREADLRAQLAANRVAGTGLARLVERHGLTLVRDGMAGVLDYAERRTRASIERIPDGRYRARDVLEEDGGEPTSAIAVAVAVRGAEVEVDFTGTDRQSAGNLNCPLSVTKSAVYYVLRVATDPDIPASAGAYRPIAVTAPPGCLVNARPPAAVAGGNVETSSRIADVVMLALGEALPMPAQGQGTMNNLTLGNDAFTYYETLGGGQGACPDADGPSAVHVAMSNTLNTPVEALEQEFPLRVRSYSLRRGLGRRRRASRRRRAVREIEAQVPMEYSLLTSAAGSRRAGPRAAAPEPPAGTSYDAATGRSRGCPRRRRGASKRARHSGSRRPGAAATALLEPPAEPPGR